MASRYARSLRILSPALVAPVLVGLCATAAMAQPTAAKEPVEASAAGAEETAPAEDAAQTAEDPTEVSIVGTKVRETSGSAHVIRPQQLERFEHSDPHQVLLAVPGVYVRGEDGFGLRPNIGMRGALSDRSKKVTLMEDGVLFGPAPYSAPAAYYFPLITRMQSVKVVKGPSAIAYGPHTVAGAIDLVTAAIPDGAHASADLAFGMYLSRKAHVRISASGDYLGVMIEGVHEANEGFKDLDGGGDTGYARNEVMAKARASFGNDQTLLHDLELKLGFSSEDSNETYLGLTAADFEANPYRRYAASQLDRMQWHRTQVVLTHTAQKGTDVELVSTLYRHDMNRVWRKVNGFRGASVYEVLRNPDDPRNGVFYGVISGAIEPSTPEEDLLIGPNDRSFVSQGFQTKLLVKQKTGPVDHRFELGTRIHQDSISRFHSEDAFTLSRGRLESTGEPTRVTAENEGSTLALAGWAIYAGTLGPVTLTGGARVESIQSRYDDVLAQRQEGIVQQVVLPGGGVFVALPEGFGLLGGVYQGFSPIPPGQSAAVTPEKSINVEWGARFAPTRLVRIEAIGFFNKYSNLSNVCTFSSGCSGADLDRQFDAGEATVIGLEAFAEAEVKLTDQLKAPARLAYTLTRAVFDNGFESSDPIFGSVQADDQVPYIPTHQLSVSTGVEADIVGGNLSGTFSSAMRETAGSGAPDPNESTDDYFLLDASVYAKPFEFMKVYAVGRNLLNMEYIASHRPYGARPGAPIWLQLGTKLTY